MKTFVICSILVALFGGTKSNLNNLPIKRIKPSGGSCSAGGGAKAATRGDEEVAARKAAAAAAGTTKRKRWAEDVAEVGSYEFAGRPATEEETEKIERANYPKMPWTDESDFSIRLLLDAAEDFIVSEPEKAVTMVEDILREHPNSPRARYDLLRAYDAMNVTGWPEEKLQKHHHKILKGYKALIDDHENVLFAIYNSAVHQAANYATHYNLTEQKSEILEKAVNIEGTMENERFHLVLAIDAVYLKDYEGLLRIADRALEKFPSNLLIKLLKGFALKRLERKKEANQLLRSMEATAEDGVTFGFDLEDLGHELLRRGRKTDATVLNQEASKAHLYLSSQQRPLEGLDDLESKPTWNLEDDVGLTAHHDDMQDIKDKLEVVRKEVSSLSDEDWHVVRNNHVQTGNWSEAPLFTFGRRRHHTCSLLPQTCRLVQASASSRCAKCTAKVVRLTSGTHLRPHCGPTNARLRLLLPIAVPATGGDGDGAGCAHTRVGARGRVEWREGEWAALDDSYEHEVWNQCDGRDVLALSLDVPHPDLSVQAQVNNKFNKNGRALFAQI